MSGDDDVIECELWKEICKDEQLVLIEGKWYDECGVPWKCGCVGCEDKE
jgi:hypothetical protein